VIRTSVPFPTIANSTLGTISYSMSMPSRESEKTPTKQAQSRDHAVMHRAD
jgi:hypothetical protein